MGKSLKKEEKQNLISVVLKKDYPTSKGVIPAGKKVKVSELGLIDLTNKKYI